MTAIEAPGLLTFTIAIVVFFAGAGLNRIIPPLRRWNIPEAVTGGLLAAVLTLIAYVGLGIEIGFSLDARVMRRDKSPSRLMFLRCSRKSLPTQQCHGEGRRGRKEVMATFIVICQ
jgi:Na+/glutamate symporter